MYESQKLFNRINTDDLNGKSLDEVVLMCRNSDNKMFQNKCTAYLMKNLFPMIVDISNKFPLIPLEDRFDQYGHCLARSIKKFDPSKKIKFSSYFYGNLKHYYMNLNNTITKAPSREMQRYTVALPPEQVNFRLSSVKAPQEVEKHSEFINNLKNSSILSSSEVNVCVGILLGYKTCRDLVKFLLPLNVLRYNDNEKKAQQEVSKLKKSIKEKVKANKFSFI